MPAKQPTPKHPMLDPVESGVVEIFADLVRLFGLPPSVGAIYGLLFISREPLCLDDIVARLGISKGSASQGLAFLRQLGALRPAVVSARREYFTADLELKKLVGAFLRSEVLPQIDRGLIAVESLNEGLAAGRTDEKTRFLRDRLSKLGTWQKRGGQVLGLVHRFLD
jgi:DNA-binding transcriptional regulator GbsR (MarR family)